MNAITQLTRSSIGKKWIVALTGLAMFLFVIGHMVGNLQLFLGPEAINNYGALLRTSPELLWVIRLVLLSCVGLHVLFALLLTIENKKARPIAYAKKASVQAKLSTKLMAVTGLVLLAFIVFHILHFTTHSVDASYDGFHDEKGRHDIFRMVVVGFSNPAFAIGYAIAMTMLASHLSHGAWSWMQTVGLRTRKVAEDSTRGAKVIAIVLSLGFVSVPATVLLTPFGKDYVKERERTEQGEKMATSPDQQAKPAKEAK